MKTCRCGSPCGEGSVCISCRIKIDHQKNAARRRAKGIKPCRMNYQAMILGYFKDTAYSSYRRVCEYGSNADGILL